MNCEECARVRWRPKGETVTRLRSRPFLEFVLLDPWRSGSPRVVLEGLIALRGCAQKIDPGAVVVTMKTEVSIAALGAHV